MNVIITVHLSSIPRDYELFKGDRHNYTFLKSGTIQVPDKYLLYE